MVHQGIGLALDIDAICAEQFRLDRVKAHFSVGPGIDLHVEFGNEAGGEYFRTLPAGPGGDPGLPGTCEIPSPHFSRCLIERCGGLTSTVPQPTAVIWA